MVLNFQHLILEIEFMTNSVFAWYMNRNVKEEEYIKCYLGWIQGFKPTVIIT